MNVETIFLATKECISKIKELKVKLDNITDTDDQASIAAELAQWEFRKLWLKIELNCNFGQFCVFEKTRQTDLNLI